jgi:hypothetical protein
MGEICLVDGVGQPRVIDLPDDPIPPISVQYAHEGIPSGPDHVVTFWRTSEVDPAGRVVYRLQLRQDWTGVAPAIRSYLLPLRTEFRRLRVEGG